MLTSLLTWPPSPLWRFRRSLGRPGIVQQRLLSRMIHRAAGTAWGRAHRFEQIHKSGNVIEEYQRRVPLSTYDDLKPHLDRVIDGESDVLWPGQPAAFAVSGGTQSGGRHIPVSEDTMKFLSRSSLLPGLSYLASRPDASAILRGKILSLPGCIEERADGSGRPVGEVSGLLAHRAPRLLSKWLQALPQHVMLMENWNEKLLAAAELSSRLDVRSMIVVPSWAPVFLERLRDVVGTTTSAEAVRRVWPQLKVVFCGGVPLSTYRATLQSILGPHIDLVESYSASEGLFAFQDSNASDGLVVNLTGGVFFEFVPLEEHNSTSPPRHTIQTIESGIDYVLHVTNTSGLWSMCVDDIVRFESTRPPRLRVIGRTGEMLDRFGDATRAEHARQVIVAADRETGARNRNYHLTYFTESQSTLPRHHWIIEFHQPPPDTELYRRTLDEYMQHCNGRYRTRREPGAMAGPHLTVVPPGSFAAYLQRTRTRYGGQSKVVHVSDDDTIAGGIILTAQVTT